MSCLDCLFDCFKNKYNSLHDLDTIAIINNDKTIEISDLRTTNKLSDSIINDEEEIIYETILQELPDQELVRRNIKKEQINETLSDSDDSWDDSLF